MKKKQSTTPDKKITGQNETGQVPVSEFLQIVREQSDVILSKTSKHLKSSLDNPNLLFIVSSDGKNVNYSLIGRIEALSISLVRLMSNDKHFEEAIYRSVEIAIRESSIKYVKQDQNEKDTNKLPEA